VSSPVVRSRRRQCLMSVVCPRATAVSRRGLISTSNCRGSSAVPTIQRTHGRRMGRWTTSQRQTMTTTREAVMTTARPIAARRSASGTSCRRQRGRSVVSRHSTSAVARRCRCMTAGRGKTVSCCYCSPPSLSHSASRSNDCPRHHRASLELLPCDAVTSRLMATPTCGMKHLVFLVCTDSCAVKSQQKRCKNLPFMSFISVVITVLELLRTFQHTISFVSSCFTCMLTYLTHT